MDNQIGVSAYRRSEMGIAAQVETKMAEILRRIFRLRLTAQHHLVDHALGIAALYHLQDAVDRIRAECPAFGDGNIERRQKLPQRSDLLRGRLVVDAIDQRDVAALASFRWR